MKKIFIYYLPPLLLAMAISFFSHYSSWEKFGFHLEDYSFVLPHLENIYLEELRNIDWGLVKERPAFKLIVPLLSHYAFAFGDFAGLRLVGFIILTLLGYCSFLIFYKVLQNYLFALGSMALFILFPLDRTHSVLLFNFHPHLSLLWAMIAITLIAHEYIFMACLFSILSILTYESSFLLILVAPILFFPFNFKKYLKVLFPFVLILLCNVALRFSYNDSRVNMLLEENTYIMHALRSVRDSTWLIFTQMMLNAFHNITIISIITSIIITIIIYVNRFRIGIGNFRYPSKTFLRHIAAAFFLIGIHYFFNFEYNFYDYSFWRASLIHIPSALGGTLLLVSLLLMLFNYSKKHIGIIVLFIFVQCIWSFMAESTAQQSRMVDLWKNDHHHISSLTSLLIDVPRDSVIIIDKGISPFEYNYLNYVFNTNDILFFETSRYTVSNSGDNEIRIRINSSHLGDFSDQQVNTNRIVLVNEVSPSQFIRRCGNYRLDSGIEIKVNCSISSNDTQKLIFREGFSKLMARKSKPTD